MNPSQPSNYPDDRDYILPLESSAPLESSVPLEAVIRLAKSYTSESNPTPDFVEPTSKLSTAPVERVPDLHTPIAIAESIAPIDENNTQVVETARLADDSIQLLGERVIVDRQRRKIGEVIVRKVVETQIIEIPIHREKLVVEQVNPERKQLAVIDLNPDYFTSVDAIQEQFTRDRGSDDSFTSAAQAAYFLETELSRLGFNPQTARVKLVFADASLKALYQQHTT
jgi:Domain of unknown function (DUF2382)